MITVLKIIDIYVNNAVNNENACILGIHDRRVQGGLRLGLMDGVKITLGSRGMTVEAALQ